MLVWLLDYVGAVWPAAGEAGRLAELTKTTPRACLAACVSFLLALWMGPRVIAWLQTRFREPIKSDSETLRQLHRAKHATPTMGGLFMVAGLLAGLAAFADLTNRYVQVAALLAVGLAAVGAIDDLAKLRSAGNGLSARAETCRPVGCGAGRSLPGLRPAFENARHAGSGIARTRSILARHRLHTAGRAGDRRLVERGQLD